jgi:putative transcriptional regulator
MKNRLKEFRQLNRWSQSDLARELGVSRQAINGFESGKFDPSLDMAFRLSHLLDAAIQDIFTHTENQPMNTLFQRFTSFLDFLKFLNSQRPSKPDTVIGWTESTILALSCAGNFAENSEIGAKQLLAGLLSNHSSIATQLLQANGATLLPNITIQDTIQDAESRPPLGFFEVLSMVPSIPLLNAEGEFVLEMAEKIVRFKGQELIGPEHLLWGLIRLSETGNSSATTVFQQSGINLAILNQQLIEAI